jgi:hypothetical protein
MQGSDPILRRCRIPTRRREDDPITAWEVLFGLIFLCLALGNRFSEKVLQFFQCLLPPVTGQRPTLFAPFLAELFFG